MRSERPSSGARPLAPTASRTYLFAGQALAAPALPGGLYVVATPIGNLKDMSIRALETLAACDLIACEDTRVTRKLTEHYGLRAPTTPYHDHNAEAARPKILATLAEGKSVSLVSDAGTPLISDPGYRLVREATAAGHAVTAIPGASSVMAALSIAGQPTDRFFFEGFLPAKSAARTKRIAELARIPASIVLFETGPRLAAALRDLADGLGARPASICRELTKLHEEVRRDSLPALAEAYATEPPPRGELVIVIGPPPQAEAPNDTDLDAMLRAAMERASVKDAVAEIASATGIPRGAVYRRALALKE